MRVAIIPAADDKPVRIEEIEPSLSVLQELVGGYLEAVHLGSGAVMYVDEEGKLKGTAEANVRATGVMYKFRGQKDVIFGDVVVLGEADEEGNETSLPNAFTDPLLALNRMR